MRQQKHIKAGGASLFTDYATLLLILESHYIQKNEWRGKAGIYEDSPEE